MEASIDRLSPDRFQNIEKWTDMKQFAGKIVAVKSPSYYFTHTYLGKSESFFKTHSVGAFTFPDISVAFAHVSSAPNNHVEGGTGYDLHHLLKIKASRGAPIVNKKTLNEYGPLQLRFASTEELQRIRKAVSSSLATFSSWEDSRETKETNAILASIPLSKL